jgi:outer membrane protein
MKSLLLPVAVSVLLLGCSGSDPLGVLAGRSTSPSRPTATTIQAVSTPAPVSESVEPSMGEELGFEECIDLSLRRNPRTRAAYLAAQAAATDVGLAKGAFLPTAELGLDTALSGTPGSVMGGDPGVGASLGFSLRYLLFDGGVRRGRLEGARANLQAADFRHQTVLLDVAMDVEEAWFSLQGALWYQTAAEEIIRQAQYQFELAEARHSVGLARKYDVVQATAKLAEAELLRTTASSQVRQGRGALAKALGLDVRTELKLKGLPEDQAAVPPGDIDLLIAEALSHRPEIGEAQSRIEAALADARIARAGHAPAISVSASVSQGFDTRSDPATPWQVGAGISLPLFSGFEPTYGLSRALFNERKARAELALEVTDIQFEVWAAHSTVQEAVETVAANRKVVAAAQEAVALAEENYKHGLGTIGEVFDAQAARATARLELVRARVVGFLALARLERAVGRILAGPGGGTR